VTDSEREGAVQTRRSFGEELRRERELRQVTLREVAESTKINLRFLEALENNDFDILPGGFFVRGFIKSFARHLGINEEAMVNAYLLELNQQKSRTPAATATPPAGEPTAPPRPTAPAAAARPGTGSGARLVTVGASLLAFSGLAFLLWNGVRQMGQGAVQQTAASPAHLVEPAADTTGGSSAAPLAEPAPETRRVELSLRERAWIRILCDGREVVNRTLDAGSRRTFECQDEVTLSASDAGALEVEISGRSLPLPGGPGQRLTPLVVRRQDWDRLTTPAAAVETTP
jgi:hypothetical protein